MGTDNKNTKRKILILLIAFVLTVSNVLGVFAESITDYSDDGGDGISMNNYLTSAISGDSITLHCQVSINGSWTKVGTVQSDGYYNGRYYVKASTIADIFSPYGFELQSYENNPTEYMMFGHEMTSKHGTIWWDSLDDYSELADGTVVIPTGNAGGYEYDLFYTPTNTNQTNGTLSDYTLDQTFYEVEICDTEGILTGELAEQTGTQYIMNGDTKSITLKIDDTFNWICTDAEGTEVEGTIDSVNQTITYRLSGNGSYTIDTNALTLTLKLNDGTEKSFWVPYNTSIYEWLNQNGDYQISESTTHPNVEAYTWKIENSDVIITESTASIKHDTSIVGTTKELVKVTFAEIEPGTSDEEDIGGSFTNNSSDYVTYSLYQGGTIPAEFFHKMRENIELKDTHTFVGWYYSDNTIFGELEVTPGTEIVSDMTVYAKYKTKATYTFYTDRTLQTIYQQFSDLSIGSAFDRNMENPTSSDGKLFRYWINVTENKVFSANDLVTGDAQFYPVFERLIFEFRDGDDFIYSLYEGDSVKYTGEPEEDEYFAGFKVSIGEGDSEYVIIPNDATVTADILEDMGITLPGVDEGKYIIQAEAIYKKQHTIIYHNGSDGQLVVTDSNDSTRYTNVVNNTAELLGALDIMNTTSSIGLALEGWALNEADAKAGIKDFLPYDTLNESELDEASGNDRVLELWPVWGQTDTSVKIVFKSNYPEDAVDDNGNSIKDMEYTIYIPIGTKPSLPVLEKIGMQEPANEKYTIAGWSVDKSGTGNGEGFNVSGMGGDEIARTYGVYSLGSQYDVSVDDETVFYAIWLDKEAEEEDVSASFFIRLDGTLPKEPNQYSDTSAYSPSSKGHTFLAMTDALYEKKNVVNDSEKVEANVKNEPTVEKLLEALYADGYANTNSEYWEDMIKGYTQNSDGSFTYSGEGSSYGTQWWIEWYACKSVSCGAPGCYYHVDGRIRFSNEFELNYHGNGGSNVPAGTVHKKDSVIEPQYLNGSTKPTRDNHIFMGWSENADALYPTYYDPDYLKDNEVQGNPLTEIQMNEDKDLYAIWEPASTMVPLDGAFSGRKILTSTDDEARLSAGDFSFRMELIQKPDKANEWSATDSNDADGAFDFGQIEIKYPGTYIFEIKEIIGSNVNIQYDTSVYRLTIRMVTTEEGLGIGGYSFSKNGKPVAVNGSDVADAVFQFTNQHGIRDVSVTKIWDDANDADGLRADSVEVSLFRNGSLMIGENGTQALNASNGWSYIWEDLPTKDELGVAYVYEVKENTEISGYTSQVSGDMYTGFEITNSHEVMDREVTIEKIVTGNMGDTTKKFDFTISARDKDGNVVTDFEPPKDGSYEVDSDGTISFKLMDGESIVIKDVPYASTLVVTENDYSEDKYETGYSDAGKLNGTENSYLITDDLKITVTNHKEIQIDAGVLLGGAGYLTALLAAISGISIIIWRRRRRDE